MKLGITMPFARRPSRLRLLIGAVLAVMLVSLVLMPAAVPKTDAAGPVDIRWGYYIDYDPTSKASLQANIELLNYVSPWYYYLEADGTISGKEDPSVSSLVRSNGAKLVPMIKNKGRYDVFHDFLANDQKVDRLVNDLLSLVQRNNYDGINIDWEAVNATDRQFLTEFMAKLSQKFRPAGKLVTMAVSAKTSDVKTGWGGSYDYKALAPHLDYAVIMAYDYRSTGSTVPGPVAPIDWVSKVADFAASQFGAGKTILGVPLYGYDWNTKKGPPAESRKHSDSIGLAQQYNGQLRYDATQQENVLNYVKDGDEHEVWFENVQSFKAKLRVISEKGLAGFGLWRLGHEDPEVWPAMAETMNQAVRPIPSFQSTRDRLYFPETGHSLSFGFKTYWERNGGLAMFGYPVTEEFREGGYTVQYFERARFEYHPEFKGTPYETELGLLGSKVTEGRRFDKSAPFTSTGERRYFPETGYGLSFGFKYYWDNNGGLPIFGYPISEEIQEVNAEDGKIYTVQYFERARFEYHPEHKGTPYETELGLLGKQVLRDRGWIR